MRIRWKLMLVLLAIALVPLSVVRFVSIRAAESMRQDLGAQIRDDVTRGAEGYLSELVLHQARLLRTEVLFLESTLAVQQKAVELCLATPPPQPLPTFLHTDYDDPTAGPDDLHISPKHVGADDSGDLVPLAISRKHPVVFLPRGVAAEAVADDVARLSALAPTYELLYNSNERFIYWQYVSLMSGVHSSYPGHGGFPLEYDPRQRTWYERARDAGGMIWSGPLVDAPSGQVILTLSAPVDGPDGAFRGVTALDVLVADLLDVVELPEDWAADSRTLLVSGGSIAARSRLEVIAEQSYLDHTARWNADVELTHLQDDDTEFAAMLSDLAAQRAGLREIMHDGELCYWAYSSIYHSDAHVLVIVPKSVVVAIAATAQDQVSSWLSDYISGSRVVIFSLVVLVIFVAIAGAHRVTDPVSRIAHAARAVADGKLDTTVKITTHDELGELGQAFNRMVPMLREHLKLRSSLQIAGEVQKQLLPRELPSIAHFDIAAHSVYCDETGGDYYDVFPAHGDGSPQWAAVVGDVAGHGIPAALLMATGRALIHSHSARGGALSEMMVSLNALLFDVTPPGRFMTLAYLVFDDERAQVHWACAGHPAPIVYDPDADTFAELEGSGLPLGIDPESQYQEFGPSSIPPNGVVVIGTDGIWEASNSKSELFGRPRLKDTIRRLGQDDAETIARGILDEVRAFRGDCPQEDDVTLLVIKRTPVSG